MSPLPTTGLWLQILGLLAAQSTLLLVVAGLSQGLARAPQSRRRVWLATLAAVALLLANSLAGLDRYLARHFTANTPSAPAVVVRANLPVTSAPTGVAASETSLLSAAANDPGLSGDVPSTPIGTSWPAWLWLAGAAAIGLWSLAPRIWLACAGRRAPAAESPVIRRRIQSLAGRLNIRRRVRVVCLPRLAGPVAFGVVRPSIGLPADFWTANSATEQDAMLAHELAHLAARDPFWLALADGLAALLWWHPLVWWGRRQLRAASEAAADEASLVVEDGPAVLAGCLVALASRWQQRGVLGLLGMAGFRSGLGRRVERLLHLREREQPALHRRWPGLVASLGAGATLALVVAVPARLFPMHAANRPALLTVVGDALAQATVSPAASTPAPSNPPGATATHPAAASATSAEDDARVPHVASLLISKDGQLMLDHREQTMESLQSELRSLLLASGSLVVRVSAPETVQAARVNEVVSACRAAGVTRISLGIPAEDEAPVLPLLQDAKLLYEMGHLTEAQARLEAVLRESPGDPSAKYLLGLVREAAAKRATTPTGTNALRQATDQPTPPANATASATNQFYTRSFKVEPQTLAAGLEALAGKGATNLTAQEQLRALFVSAGLDFAPMNAAAADQPPARALFYNDRNGVVLVRATLPELDIVEQVLQVLNAAQPQVMIEAKFVEVVADTNAPLGFDWYLGNVHMGTNQPAGTAPAGRNGLFPGARVPSAGNSTGNVGTMTGILTDPQFRDVIAALERAGTNGVRELRGDQLAWPGRDATNAANIRVTAAQGATVTGILTDPQYRVLLRALEQRAGVDVLSAPRVTTLSGRQAQIQVADIRTVLTGLNADALRVPGATPATNGLPFSSASIPTGPSLDVIPVVAADGVTINLTVIPTVTEFLGYDAPPKNSKVEVMENGKARLVDLPLPRFRVRQMVTQAAIRDGQTLVLDGFPVEETRLTKDKVPVLGDIPLAGGLFRSESKSTVRKQLLVFVTATVIDPAGNRVNASASTPAPAPAAP